MTLAQIIRLVPLALFPLTGLPAPAEAASHTAPTVAVIGDSLACPRTAAGEVAVCGDKISAVSLLNLHAYASCLVVHHRSEADLATRSYARWRDREPLRALVADDRACLPKGGARMSAILLASALAEQLPGWRRRLHAGFTKADQPADMVQCLVAMQPNLALAVLRSAPLSDDELAAVHKLVPALPTCLPSGARLETNRAALRALLALALLDPATPDPAMPATTLHASLSGPLLMATPRLSMVPLATVGALRDRITNVTVPGWTQMPDEGLHHGDYGHPDLAAAGLPEDQLADTAIGPFKDEAPQTDPLKGSFPGSTSDVPAPRP